MISLSLLLVKVDKTLVNLQIGAWLDQLARMERTVAVAQRPIAMVAGHVPASFYPCLVLVVVAVDGLDALQPSVELQDAERGDSLDRLGRCIGSEKSSYRRVLFFRSNFIGCCSLRSMVGMVRANNRTIKDVARYPACQAVIG